MSGFSTLRKIRIAAVSICMLSSARSRMCWYTALEKVTGGPVTRPAWADREGCMNHFLPAVPVPMNEDKFRVEPDTGRQGSRH